MTIVVSTKMIEKLKNLLLHTAFIKLRTRFFKLLFVIKLLFLSRCQSETVGIEQPSHPPSQDKF